MSALVFVATVAVLLFYSQKGRNAVWGTATIAGLIGVVIAIVRPGFDWWTVGKAIAIGTFLGLIFEGMGMLSDRLRRR